MCEKVSKEKIEVVSVEQGTVKLKPLTSGSTVDASTGLFFAMYEPMAIAKEDRTRPDIYIYI